jgi:uncharacterized membrane protein YeaQ/YmgE (transglycosylase-associated protein family)
MLNPVLKLRLVAHRLQRRSQPSLGTINQGRGTMFWLIRYAIFGLFAGAIARMLHPGKDPMNWFWTMLLGIGGSVVGGWIGQTIGVNTDTYLIGWVFAILGAILLLIIYHAVTNPRLRGTDTTSNPPGRRDYFNPMDRR